MMRLTIIIATLAITLIAVSVANGIKTGPKFLNDQYSEESIDPNDLIDQLLEGILKKHGHELDPHPLPDLGVSFEKKLLLITYTGKAQLHDGELTGLRTLHRDGDCNVTNDENGLHAIVNLGMGKLRFDYKGTVSFMKIGKTVDFYGSIAYLSAKLVLKGSPGEKLKVEEFKVREMNGVVVQIRKLGIFNAFVKLIAKGILALFKPKLYNILEREVKIMVEEKLQDFDLPFGYHMK